MKLLLLALLSTVSAAKWSIASSKLDISGTPYQLSTPVHAQLSPSDKVKLTFTAKLDDLAKKPHQAMLVIANPNGLEQTVVVPVKQNGRGTFTFASSDLNEHLKVSQLELSLILGGFGDDEAAEIKLATLEVLSDAKVPYTLPVSPLRYAALPEITHTFKPDQVMPPVVVSIGFSLVLGLGVLGLLSAWMTLGVNVDAMSSALQKAPIAYTVFIGSLVSIELLFVVYWLQLRILAALALLGGLSVPLFFSGRFALREVEARRKAGLR